VEIYKIKNLTFTYPTSDAPAISDLSIDIEKGHFVTLCGRSGCGKTTLLRQLKPTLAPYGQKSGEIIFEGCSLDETTDRVQAEKIGFVLQSPDNQLVTDKVWHELAFGLESLGMSTNEIRSRVSEMASFFGIQSWFNKKVSELSGGQKQLLNLASVMVMQPSVLILDEPTSQLDPIAAQDFLETLAKINRELGTTIILSEHRLEDAFPMSDRVIVMEQGKVIADGTPNQVGKILKDSGSRMFAALPAPMRIYSFVENDLECPITVRDGRKWLDDYALINPLDESLIPTPEDYEQGEVAAELKDVYFRYEKDEPDVVDGLSLKVYKGEFYAIVGGNAAGKTTTLSIIGGLLKPHSGKVKIFGEDINKIADKYNGLLGILPQNPQALFVKKTVKLDLEEMLSTSKLTDEEKGRRISEVCRLCELEHLLEQHPYDLSGGEQQRAALAKVLLLSPGILLMDEPTKGLDADFKQKFADIIHSLTKSGVTVIMVSHDIEFCAKYAHRCAMFFGGKIMSEDKPQKFFSGKNFYTTAANRMARGHLPSAVLAEDVILACGGKLPKKENSIKTDYIKYEKKQPPVEKKDKRWLTPKRIFWGLFFVALLVLTQFFLQNATLAPWQIAALQLLTIIEGAFAAYNFLPDKKIEISAGIQQPKEKRKLSKRTIAAALMGLIAIPLTIFIGVYYLQDRKYYFICLLIIIETIIPFLLAFEGRKPKARELMIVSVLCAIAVAGREAFFMLPQFKPVAAIVIIAGICFGGETGFLVGAITGFVSNFFLGQGAWTPWQMFAFGIVGFIAGLLFNKGFIRKTKMSLCLYGGLSVLIIYGLIMDTQSMVLLHNPSAKTIMSIYYLGIPFNLIHAASTVFFLWFIAEPMIEKLDRIKTKYGILGDAKKLRDTKGKI